ncbi:MAG TPA: hypothetical protein VFT91_02910 [Dehalococcoidia bacterium]|nr:hypothetical protein [Dehalococcoidia bacterium]
MVSRMDEYLVHQTEKPLSQVASDHPDWQDRFYFNIHDPAGEFAAITGLGAFPNRKMVQAYLFVVYKGQHYAFLNVRPLADDREVMQAGRLSYSIVEPLNAWRLEIADEANGISGSLEFRARCPLYLFSPIHWRNGDKLVAHQMHYTQAGRYTGTFTIGDRVFSDLRGMRDRSWGVRAMADVPVWFWVSAQFDDFCISAWLWETRDGETIHADGALVPERGEPQPITRIEHDLELWPGTKRPREGRFRLTTTAGETLSLTASEIGSIFLGPLASRWSDGDASALAAADTAAFGFDQHCRFRMGDKTGIGIVEYMMTGGSRRYGIPPTKIGG